eukprot:1634097-Alexandrium_andersonii.AAC.1
MSASLVGSEMCIRDSCRIALIPRERDRSRQARPDTQAARGKQQVAHELPVSYTHLTLPTICSV